MPKKNPYGAQLPGAPLAANAPKKLRRKAARAHRGQMIAGPSGALLAAPPELPRATITYDLESPAPSGWMGVDCSNEPDRQGSAPFFVIDSMAQMENRVAGQFFPREEVERMYQELRGTIQAMPAPAEPPATPTGRRSISLPAGLQSVFGGLRQNSRERIAAAAMALNPGLMRAVSRTADEVRVIRERDAAEQRALFALMYGADTQTTIRAFREQIQQELVRRTEEAMFGVDIPKPKPAAPAVMPGPPIPTKRQLFRSRKKV